MYFTKQKGAYYLASVLMVLFVCLAVGQAEEKQGPSLEFDGSVQLKLKYAWGDGAALLGTGFTPGQADLWQRTALKVHGEIASGLSISADLDNEKGDYLQVLEIRLQKDPYSARFGGLSLKLNNPYAAYSGRLRGIELAAAYPKVDIGAALGRVQGVAAKKTFRGTTAQETILYEPGGPYGPSPGDESFLSSLDGLEFFVLEEAFDPDFMGAWLRYADQAELEGRTLRETLELWGLGYLYSPAEEDSGLYSGRMIALDPEQYAGVSSDQEMLALRLEIRDLLRSQILALIKEYNEEQGLVGPGQKRYPFTLGSSTEKEFLEDLLQRHLFVAAGRDQAALVLDVPAASYERRRLYDLGQLNIEPGTVEVEIRRAGRFFAAEIEPGLLYQVHYQVGLVEFDFPPGFFAAYDGIRITYNYDIALGVFNLGLAIVEGSEKVYLNKDLLQRNVDYSLDYELGLLMIFHSLTEDDVITVEYEYFRGPFGKMADYKANAAAVSLGWTPLEGLRLNLEAVRYAEDPLSGPPPSSTATMPNVHTIAGLSGSYSRGSLSVSGDLAISHDQFPFDANQKLQAPNKITAIAALADFIVFAHHDGISAGQDLFQGYGVGAGLSAYEVRGAASTGETLFLATADGLTCFSLGPTIPGQNPFDYAGNWRRLYASSGLPSGDLHAVAVTPWAVWVGTGDKGVAWADLADLESWQVFGKESGLPSNSITQIAYDPMEDLVFVGSDQGIAVLRGSRFEVELAEPISALWSAEKAVRGIRTFAAGPKGVYARSETGDWQRILELPTGEDALALAVWDGLLWVGSSQGLYFWNGEDLGSVEAAQGLAVTALGCAPGLKHSGLEVLWAGSAAGSQGIFALEILTPEVVFAHDGRSLEIGAADPRRYVDLPREGHTAVGYAARTNVSYDLDQGSVYGSWEKTEPGFTKIGQTSRQARDQLTVGAQWSLGPKVDLQAEHSRSLTRTYQGLGTEKPEREVLQVMSTVSSSIDVGAKLDVAYTQSQIDDQPAPGFERREQVLTAGASRSFLEGKLSVSGKYERVKSDNLRRVENSYVQNTWRGDIKLTLESFTASASYRRPVKTVDPGGGNHVSGITESRFTAQWNGEVRSVKLRAHYRQVARSNMATLKKFNERLAEVKAVFPEVSLNTLEMTPTVLLKWQQTLPFAGQARRSWEVQGSISGTQDDLKVTAGANVKQTVYFQPDKTVLDTELYGSLGFALGENLKPQIDLRWKRSQAQRPDLGSVSTHTLTGTFRLVWLIKDGLSSVGTVTLARSSSTALQGSGRVTLTVRDVLNWKISERLSATGEIVLNSSTTQGGAKDLKELKLTLKAGMGYRLSERWALNASAGWYQLQRSTQTGGAARGITLEVGLEASF